MSLRGRLLIASAALVAVGLSAAGIATYSMVRSSLVGRIDRQLNAVLPVAPREPGDASGDRPGGGPRRQHEDLPPASYTGLVQPDGEVAVWRSYGFEPGEPPPDLPRNLPGSTDNPEGRTLMTVAGPSIRYRVLAASLSPGGGTIIVAMPLSDVDATLNRLLFIETAAGAAVLAAVIALALWLVRVGLRPLERIGDTAGAIAAGDLSRRVEPADPSTEIGKLSLSLNAMLERIEAAFAERAASEDRLRRFIADASHELRTPLTSIRGYAELFRIGAEQRPEDLQKAMRRIEQESVRMGALVDELLLLARLDQGRPLERRPVDLSAIASDAVADARAIDPDRDVTLDAPAAVIVGGDEMRLRQVTANLLANVREHTPAGTPATVRVARDGNTAVLSVSDRGPGMNEADAKRAFDRFFRADPARARETGGAGLGLSIVEAVAAAHGGTVECITAVGEGTTFVVRLPVEVRPQSFAERGTQQSPPAAPDFGAGRRASPT